MKKLFISQILSLAIIPLLSLKAQRQLPNQMPSVNDSYDNYAPKDDSWGNQIPENSYDSYGFNGTSGYSFLSSFGQTLNNIQSLINDIGKIFDNLGLVLASGKKNYQTYKKPVIINPPQYQPQTNYGLIGLTNSNQINSRYSNDDNDYQTNTRNTFKQPAPQPHIINPPKPQPQPKTLPSPRNTFYKSRICLNQIQNTQSKFNYVYDLVRRINIHDVQNPHDNSEAVEMVTIAMLKLFEDAITRAKLQKVILTGASYVPKLNIIVHRNFNNGRYTYSYTDTILGKQLRNAVTWNPTYTYTIDCCQHTPYRVLGHELMHALAYMENQDNFLRMLRNRYTNSNGYQFKKYSNEEERRVILEWEQGYMERTAGCSRDCHACVNRKIDNINDMCEKNSDNNCKN